MNKTIKLMAIAGVSTLFFSGCGMKYIIDSPKSTSAVNKNEKKEQHLNQNNEVTEAENNVIRLLEQNLHYSHNGETKDVTAFLKYNDNQNYSMYVLPEFELTSEEPNKDVLYLLENENTFMRIELLPIEVDWGMLEDNSILQLQAVNKEVKKIDVPNDIFFKDAWASEARKDGQLSSIYLIKNDQQPLKLTIFSNESDDMSNAFLEMAKTILPKMKN